MLTTAVHEFKTCMRMKNGKAIASARKEDRQGTVKMRTAICFNNANLSWQFGSTLLGINGSGMTENLYRKQDLTR